MRRSALVITNTPSLGEQITQVLDTDKRYDAQIIDNLKSALEKARQDPFQLMVLDVSVAGKYLEQAARILRLTCPGAALILVPAGNWVSSALMSRIAPDGILTRPVSQVDLVNVLDVIQEHSAGDDSLEGMPVKLAKENQSPNDAAKNRGFSNSTTQGVVIVREGAGEENSDTDHSWLYDVRRAAQYLARLSLETSAQAALIVRSGQIWAYAGQVSQSGAQELAQEIAVQWERQETASGIPRELHKSARRDLIRFTRLSDDQEFILYATGLVEDLVLALAFDAHTPFRMIRAQAMHLVQALSQPPESSDLVGAMRKPADKMQKTAAHPSKFSDKKEDETEAADLRLKDMFYALLNDVPPSNPGSSSPRPHGLESPSNETSGKSGASGFSVPAGLPISPAILNMERSGQGGHEESVDHPLDPSGYAGSNMLNEKIANPEPVTPALSRLVYTCILVPRVPTHSLTGDLAAHISEWLPRLCVAYGWRLEKLEQRKDYIAWIVRVQLDTSPSKMIRLLRQQTSQRIFAEFPSLARDNPSGDFWAPGYLILSSGELPSVDVIRSFIQQTRVYQGGSGPIITSSTG